VPVANTTVSFAVAYKSSSCLLLFMYTLISMSLSTSVPLPSRNTIDASSDRRRLSRTQAPFADHLQMSNLDRGQNRMKRVRVVRTEKKRRRGEERRGERGEKRRGEKREEERREKEEERRGEKRRGKRRESHLVHGVISGGQEAGKYFITILEHRPFGLLSSLLLLSLNNISTKLNTHFFSSLPALRVLDPVVLANGRHT